MQHTPIKTIINFLKNQKGCHFSRMTGSGSVCFGVFDSINASKKALRNVKGISQLLVSDYKNYLII